MPENNKQEFVSHLNKLWVWVLIFIFFVIMPISILLTSFQTIVKNDMSSTLEASDKYYNGELISFRGKASNEKIFLQLFRGFKQQFKLAMPDLSAELTALKSLKQGLPAETTIIIWDKDLNIIPSLCSKKILLNKHDKIAKSLVTDLMDTYADFSSKISVDQQKNTQQSTASISNESFYKLYNLSNPKIDVSEMFTSPDSIFSVDDYSNSGYFYWSFFNSKDNSIGAFAAFIPRRNIDSTYGISRVIDRDPMANPEFTNGYFNAVTNETKLSYPKLMPVALELTKKYQVLKQNPVKIGHWLLNVLPMEGSSEANVFSMYSVKAIEQNYSNRMRQALIIALLIAIAFGFSFSYHYKKSKTTGLSLKMKLASLFFLCMMLPISILILLGLRFSASQEKLLSIEAISKLESIVKQVDTSATEFYRTTSNWLSTIKMMPSVKKQEKTEIIKQLKGFINSGFIDNLYLVDINGDIVFDMDNVTKKTINRSLIKQLGKKIVTNSATQSSSMSNQISSARVFMASFIDAISQETEALHMVDWPGESNKKFVYSDLVISAAGEPIGLIATISKEKLDRAYLKETISKYFTVNKNTELFAISSDDISDSIPNLTMTFKANILPSLAVAKIKHEPRTNIVSGANKRFLSTLLNGKDVSGYIIGARIDWNTIVESIWFMYALVGLALSGTLLASFLLVTLLTKEFLTPVLLLSKSAKAITNGNLDPNLPIFAKDELGELSETFKFMTTRLRNRLTELTVLYNLTQKASTSTNQREVFGMAAKDLKKHLVADHATMAWVNEGEGDASLYITESRNPDEAKAIQHSAQKALNTSRTTLERFDNLGLYIISIPLFFEDRKFGAVSLFFPLSKFEISGELSEDERSFVETLRHHLSLIIEKQRLFEQAITDGLTKLYVRRFFMATLDKEMARSRRYDLHLSVIMLDIDHFKQFNDEFGHQAGDLVLKETAQRIMEAIRTVDTPGRYGGEEMVVILPQTHIKDAYIVAERMRKSIEASEYVYKGTAMKVAASIGISSISSRDIQPETIIEEADRALYRAKEKGRNQVQIAPEAM